MLLLPFILFQGKNEATEEVLIIPQVRKLSEFEESFVAGSFEKNKLLKLEKLEFPGGIAYISMPEGEANVVQRRKKLLEGLSKQVGMDGSLDFSKLDENSKDDVIMGVLGAKRKNKNANIPIKLDAIYRYQFEVKGQLIELQSGKPWTEGSSSKQGLYEMSDLIEIPTNIVNISGKDFKIGQVAHDGIQIVFQPNLHRDLLRKVAMQLEIQKAYLVYKTDEYKKNGEILDELFSKFVSADATMMVDGKAVPEAIVNQLAAELMRKFPGDFQDIDSARASALKSRCFGGDREIDLCSRYLLNGTGVTARYKLLYRPFNP